MSTAADFPTWKEVAEFLGPAYLRYSFTKGTAQEVGFLVDRLGLDASTTVLDVGCGPGRHLTELARLGIPGVGVDLAEAFARLVDGADAATGDARLLPVRSASVDDAWSLCQGGLGLVGGEDGAVLDELARVVRPGGHVVFTAFSAWFALRFLEDGDEFDAGTGAHTEQTVLRDADGVEVPYVFTTTCFTPRELRLLCERAGLRVEGIWSTMPGDYAERPPDLDRAEFLTVAHKPV